MFMKIMMKMKQLIYLKMKWNKIFTYYIMTGLSGFLSIGGALPFSNFLTGGATSTLTLPSSSSSSKKFKN